MKLGFALAESSFRIKDIFSACWSGAQQPLFLRGCPC